MALVTNVTFHGASRRTYDFEVYDGTAFPNVGAIYIFTKRDFYPDGRVMYTFLYVGRTAALGNRISNHEKWKCVKEHGVDTICVHWDGNENSRRLKEKDFLNLGNIPCNAP